MRILFVSQRVEIGEAGDSRHAFVEARVIFHRTRAERIHTEIDRVVPGRHANEVTNHVDFAHFRHAFEIVVTAKLRGNVQFNFIDVERRQAITDTPGLRTLEDELLVWTDVTRDFSDCCGHGPILFRERRSTLRSAGGCLFPSHKPENHLADLT